MLADDEVVAVLTLESTKEDVKLAILKVNEWEVREITPVVYSYELCLPEEYFRKAYKRTRKQNIRFGHVLKNPPFTEERKDTYECKKSNRYNNYYSVTEPG